MATTPRGPSASKPSRFTRVLAAAAIVPVLAVTACGGDSKAGTSSSGSKVGESLTFGTIAAPPTLNPATSDPAYGSVLQWAYDPLIQMKPDGTFAAGLAVKWGYVGEANKTYEMTLREGVKFSDGEALTAEAVKTFLDYARSQKTGTAAILLASIGSVNVTGPLTLQIKLKVSDPGLTFAFAQAFGVGFIASPKAVSSPASLDKGTAGAGAYMLDAEKTVAADHYVFVPNPNYWNKEAQHWKQVTVRVIPNPSSMVQAMRAGQVQAALGDATTLAAAKGAGLNVIAPPQALTGLNLVDRNGSVSKAVGDVRVRQALNYAVDRKAIAKALYGDEALALSQYALPGQAGYDEALNSKYPHDVAKAKQLLSEAGYPNGLTVETLSVNLFGLDKVTQAIAGQLKEAGVTLKLTTKGDANDYFTNMVSGKYPTVAMAYGLSNMGTLYAGFINKAGPFNPLHVSDPELDALYAKYFVASEADGPALQKQINARLVDQAWTIPVVGAPLSYYTAKGIGGLEATPQNSGVPLLTDIRPAN